ncbi:L,D-transpeptidase [Aestuariivirga sp.]|jgi:lipoprotein-anchoring transpeptidase ErfK/SrfK|uniref:L,D-transpeptidase n=1 Tax=Aestuariivirga sp. TaxID=2650926 RepID=UPI003783DFDE
MTWSKTVAMPVRQVLTGLVLLLLLVAPAQQAVASRKPKPATPVVIEIDISRQVMRVEVNGWSYARWKVSTAAPGYHTPRGSWRPFLLKQMHYSRKYDNSPMPHSIFFLGGYAIHATYSTRQLGRPASHGCIRLHPQNAARLYALVQKHGLRSTRIIIID